MAKRRKGSKGRPEPSTDGDGEDDGDKGSASKAPSHARRSRRRAERVAMVEEERRRKRIRLVALSVVVAAIVVAASVGVYWWTRPEPNPVVVFETDNGTFEVELFMDECPVTAGNFKDLTEEGFYDGLKFHRIIEGFMVQGGDPKGDGTGGPGYSIEAEDSALALEHEYGSVSMANSGSPDTAGSQFFVVTDEGGRDQLDGSYAVFGKVVKGMDVVIEISKVPVRDNGQGEMSRPIEPVYMDRVYIK